jgi:hypothetical protein
LRRDKKIEWKKEKLDRRGEGGERYRYRYGISISKLTLTYFLIEAQTHEYFREGDQ